MTITLKSLITLAKQKHSVAAVRSIIFDGKSAMCAAPMEWVAGVPCIQENITEPVIVPIEAIQTHMLKSRHLIVMPDHLTNGQGLVTPFNKNEKIWYEMVLDLLPAAMPAGEAVSFELDLNAVDRTLIAAPAYDIRHYLNGLMFDLTEGVLAGCDGHRLHIYKNRVPQAYKRKVVDGDFSAVVMPLRLTDKKEDGTRVYWEAQAAQDAAKQPEPVPAARSPEADHQAALKKHQEDKAAQAAQDAAQAQEEAQAGQEEAEVAQAAQARQEEAKAAQVVRRPAPLPPVAKKNPAQEEPETPPAEPCPAAVSDIVARLIGKALIQAKPSRPARHGRKTAKPEPVAA